MSETVSIAAGLPASGTADGGPRRSAAAATAVSRPSNPTNADRYKMISDALGVLSWIEWPVIAILTCASGYYTYHGVIAMELNKSPDSLQLHAALLAAAVTAGIFLLLASLISLLPHLAGSGWHLPFRCYSSSPCR